MQQGYAMGALLVGLAVAGILMSAALPVWSQAARREREAELVFRGEQYARAVALYQRFNAGAFPPDVETLIEERFLRRPYRDPMVEHGEFRILHESDADEPDGETPEEPRGGVIGVVSSSSEPSIRIYKGATRYDQWRFVPTEASAAPGGTPDRGAEASDAPPGAAGPPVRMR